MPRWLERMTADEIEALPRGTTVVFFPVGALEDHGPHLPVGLDLDEAETLCRMAAERLESESKGWIGVIAPRAPLAVETNTRAWAFGVRGYVLRDYLVDTGWVWLRQGFRWLVCFSGNPTARQRVAIEEAGRILSGRSSSGRFNVLQFFKGRILGPPALVSGQSGGSTPADIKKSWLGADPAEHGGKRDTSMGMWLYMDTPREPRNLPPDLPLRGTPLGRAWERLQNRRWGYWGEVSKASAQWGADLLADEVGAFMPKLRAWIDGANPHRIFASWERLLPSNRTTFRAWLLAAAILVLALAYLRTGLS